MMTTDSYVKLVLNSSPTLRKRGPKGGNVDASKEKSEESS
jgi:hypothetical protein